MLILPIEATGVLGSLAGIGEIVKATFGERRQGRHAGRAGAAADRPADGRRRLRRTCHVDVDRLARRLELVHRWPRCSCCSSWSRPAPS